MEMDPIRVKMKLIVPTMMVIIIMDHIMEVIRMEEEGMDMAIVRTIMTIQDGSTVTKAAMDIMDPIIMKVVTNINLIILRVTTIVMVRIEEEVKFVPSHLIFKTCMLLA